MLLMLKLAIFIGLASRRRIGFCENKANASSDQSRAADRQGSPQT